LKDELNEIIRLLGLILQENLRSNKATEDYIKEQREFFRNYGGG